MLTLIIIAFIFVAIIYILVSDLSAPWNLFSYIITGVITFFLLAVAATAYNGSSGSYGSFGYIPAYPALGAGLFIWAIVVAISPLISKKYNRPKVYLATLIAGTITIPLVPILLFIYG